MVCNAVVSCAINAHALQFLCNNGRLSNVIENTYDCNIFAS